MQNYLVTTAVAFAVATDAFSVSLGLGTKKINFNKITLIALVIGLFHVIMPLVGLIAGDFLTLILKDFGEFAGGIILLYIGYSMLNEYLDNNANNRIDFTRGLGLVIFAVSVSIDALTVGFTLGLAGRASIISAVIFGIVAFAMTTVGLLMGNKITYYVENKSILIGGIILIIMGGYFIIT